MWVIKRPIADLETKPWPHYEADNLLSPDSRNIALYLTRVKINGKEVEYQCSLDDIIEPSLRDLDPPIYIRVSRPLKDDSKIDLIPLDKFYQHTGNYGVSLNAAPDYGYSEHA